MNGRGFALPDDVKRMVQPVLAHRIIDFFKSDGRHGVTLIGRLFDEGTLGRAGMAIERASNAMAERPPGF